MGRWRPGWANKRRCSAAAGGSRLVVRFDGEDHPVSIRPDLVRARPVSTEQIIGQLEQLRDLVGDGDGR
jgi:hypothetical protein